MEDTVSSPDIEEQGGVPLGLPKSPWQHAPKALQLMSPLILPLTLSDKDVHTRSTLGTWQGQPKLEGNLSFICEGLWLEGGKEEMNKQ